MAHQRRPYSQRLLRLERALRFLYVGGWPAKAWALVPGALAVRRVEHRLDLGRERGRPPLRLAFASDLHIGPTTPAALLDRAFALISEARPDVVALGGDYVFLGATHERAHELRERVAALRVPVKVAVLGNHDFWARPERLADALTEAGADVLVNRSIRLPPPHDDVGLVGLDDPLTGRAQVEEALEAVADARVKVAICHSPDAVAAVRGSAIALLVCGHTHGGQIALPGYRPIVAFTEAARRWSWGLHQVDGLKLFVSRGVGGSLLPIRMYAPPDVALLEIR